MKKLITADGICQNDEEYFVEERFSLSDLMPEDIFGQMFNGRLFCIALRLFSNAHWVERNFKCILKLIF